VAHLPVGKTHTEVIAALERVGVKLSPKLCQEVSQHSSEVVIKAIEA